MLLSFSFSSHADAARWEGEACRRQAIRTSRQRAEGGRRWCSSSGRCDLTILYFRQDNALPPFSFKLLFSAAVDRISRVSPQIFGGKFLEVVDSDFTMIKRAKEVADRF